MMENKKEEEKKVVSMWSDPVRLAKAFGIVCLVGFNISLIFFMIFGAISVGWAFIYLVEGLFIGLYYLFKNGREQDQIQLNHLPIEECRMLAYENLVKEKFLHIGIIRENKAYFNKNYSFGSTHPSEGLMPRGDERQYIYHLVIKNKKGGENVWFGLNATNPSATFLHIQNIGDKYGWSMFREELDMLASKVTLPSRIIKRSTSVDYLGRSIPEETVIEHDVQQIQKSPLLNGRIDDVTPI